MSSNPAGDSLGDRAISLVAEEGVTNVATVVRKRQVLPKVDLSLSLFRKTFSLLGGGFVKFKPPAQGCIYARITRWSSLTTYSAGQIQFLQWAFNLGAKSESK